jgi:DNA-binding transcriptional MerR regulator
MRKTYDHLPRVTWDQAELMDIWPASAYENAHQIKPATIRKWASTGQLTRVAIGPNGHVLYGRDQVSRLAQARLPRVA